MKRRPEPTLHVLAAFAALTCGCASRTLPGATTIPQDNRAVLAVVREALERDAAGDAPSRLYDPFVTVVANGIERRKPPLFAGIGTGGRVTISELRGEVVEGFAWATATYRWTSADSRVMEDGRVTFVLGREGDAWRVRHAHSSVVPPWGSGSPN